MTIRIHPHARARMVERGATEEEEENTVRQGELLPTRFGRAGFRRNFPFERTRPGRYYRTKQIEVYATGAGDNWLVITVITRYF